MAEVVKLTAPPTLAPLLSVRRGRVSPSFSHDRITDGDTPARRAASPIFRKGFPKLGLALDDLILHPTWPIDMFDMSDKSFLSSARVFSP